jgi:RNA polymerase-binding transcription factor
MTISTEARRKLLQRRAAVERLERELSDEEEQLTRDRHADVVDLASVRAPGPVLETLHHAQREELRDIEAALRRIDAGTYGACESCGRLIGRPRLRAIPSARSCLACAAPARRVAT